MPTAPVSQPISQSVRAPVLGLDIGGTKLAAGVLDRDGTLLSLQVMATPPDADLGGRTLLDLGRRAVRAAGVGIGAVGIGCGGPLDVPAGRVSPINLPLWAGAPVVALATEAFDVPVALANDATAAAVGEWLHGAAKGCADVVYLTVSTGVGGGVISGGRVLQGASGNATELGHLLVQSGGRMCPCGRRGCLEAYSSGRSIQAAARERLEASDEPSSLREARHLTAAVVAAAARAGDPLASGVWDDAMRMLGIGLTIAAEMFDPELILLGGGVAKTGGQLLEAASHRITSSVGRAPDVRLASGGPAVGVIGAAAFVQHLLSDYSEERKE